MSKWIAYFTGLILSLMIYFNGQLSMVTTTYVSNVVYHGIGVLFFGITLFLFGKNKISTPFKWHYILPGIMGSLTIIINNFVMAEIGVTLMIALTMMGQVVTSLIIDQYGLLGKTASKTHYKQWIGISVMSLGIWIMLF